jgi:hypothetical protein
MIGIRRERAVTGMTHRVVVGAMALEDTFRVLNSMVGDGILRRYAVTGAVAALNYVEVTSTVDLDILISIDDLTNPSTGLATGLHPENSAEMR